MSELVERAYFLGCLALGRLLRSGRYSRTLIVHEDGALQVRKHRLFYAPFLIWMGDPLLRILDTGVRVLPQRAWEAREHQLYQSLHGASIRVDAGGTLLLPCLPGETLANRLENSEVEESVREKAIELAVVALSELHGRGFTHGDAMAENVMIDLEAGIAHWFDFETIHDSSRPIAWRRADDVRALLTTCLLRTPPVQLAGTLELIVDRYGDQEVTQLLATRFTSVWRRALTLHLGQAQLSFRYFGEIARLLKEHSHPFGGHP